MRALGGGVWPDSSWTGTEPALHRLELGLGRRKGVCPQLWGSSFAVGPERSEARLAMSFVGLQVKSKSRLLFKNY